MPPSALPRPVDRDQSQDRPTPADDKTRLRLEGLGLHLNTPEPALMCYRCRYALKPTAAAVSNHLGEKHAVPAKSRRGLPVLIRSLHLPNPNTLPGRPRKSAPHPHLTIQGGAACRKCGFLSVSLDLIPRHLLKAHGLKGDRRSWLRDGICENLALQSWTQNGCRNYWTVEAAAEEITPTDCSPRRRARLEALHQDEKERMSSNACIPSTTDTGIDDLALTSNWMRRTGWAQTFANADRSMLLVLAEGPAADGYRLELGRHGDKVLWSSAQDERALAVAGRAVDQFLDRCEDTARHTDQSIRCWLRGQTLGQPYKAPFELPGRKATRSRYRSLCKRFVFFVLRLSRLGCAVQADILSMQLSQEQWTVVGGLWTLLQSQGEDARLGGKGARQDSLPLHYESGPRSPNVDLSAVVVDRIRQGPRPRRPYRHPQGVENSSCDPVDDISILGVSDSDGDDWTSTRSDATDSSGGDAGDSDSEALCPDKDGLAAAAGPNDALADQIGKMLVHFCTEEFVDGRLSSTMWVYFSGVLGITHLGTTFERPRNYTSKISALVYCIRLCLLETALPRFAHVSIGWDAWPTAGQLIRLNRVREQ
ncbi:hypothetical protein LTR85_002038 [Meristemomyces frigidus]|nr:hypothetical protein LTR85_002038 [Meristemomyces frigidus]